MKKSRLIVVGGGAAGFFCAVNAAPIRSMAIITMRTGATVQAKAFRSANHKTGFGTSIADKGRKTKNCTMQQTHATLVAQPTNRIAPMRCTSCPLNTK